MKYFIFKTFKKDEIVIREFKEILAQNKEYIDYDIFLQAKYNITVEENEDYIPSKENGTVIMILDENHFEIMDLEDVFEVLLNELYKKEGDNYEENHHSKWIS